MKLSLVLTLFLGIATAAPLNKGKCNQYHPRSDTQHHEPFQAPANSDVNAPKPALENPDSNHPYPIDNPSGISPWNDNGRSEVQDYIDRWLYCPAFYLNCGICPLDPRCRHSPFDSWDHSSPPPTPLLPGEFAALTGPQIFYNEGLYEGAVGEIPSTCPLSRCGEAGEGECDYTTATCIQGYCVCPHGAKAVEGNVVMRGLGYLQDTRVLVDVGVACDRLCESEFCEEVERGGVCFGTEREQDGGWNGRHVEDDGRNGDIDIGFPVYQGQGSGAVNVPGAGR